ncbi:hypothetical protein Tco_0898399, partial [Tanacetum coccineum]
EDNDEDDDTGDEDEEPTEDEEEEEEHPALADSSAVPIVDPVPSAGDTEAFETDESTPTPRSPQTRARIAEHAAAPIPPTNPTYDQAPLGHRLAMICMRDDIPKEDMPPQNRFVLTASPPRCDIAESFADAAARAPKASEHRMMTSIEKVNLRVSYQAWVCRQESEDFYTQLHDARTDRRDIRLEIDIVRGQRTAYETKLHERQRAEDNAVKQMMRTYVLEARAQIDMVEDTGSSSYTQRFQELALLCTKFIADETVKIDKYIGGLLDNIHGNVMSARAKTLDFAIELANELMDQKLCTYAERQNENKRKADDSSRNNQ